MLETGTLIHDQYRIDKLVGVGGMGLVYQARDTQSGQRVAVKVMRRTILEDDSEMMRFQREARALNKLNHPNIVRVLHAGVLTHGEPYMVMELLIGRDLRTELRERGPLPVSEVAGYMLQACDAVASAHSQQVIHRDLKPQNLFITQLDGDRQIKLLDFGISKLHADGEATATATSDMLGTPHYMSPEQVRATKDVDHRTDIWSLGVVMYFLTTGKLPFAHASPTAVIAAIPFEEPKPPSWFTPDMPPAMEDLILRCLRKDASERFANAAELHAALKPFAPKGGVRVEGAGAIQSLPTVPLPKGEMAKTANPDPSAEAVTVQAAKPRGTSRNAALIGTIAGDLSTVGDQRFSLRAPKVPTDLLDDVASDSWWRSPRLWATSIALVLAVWFWWSPATDNRAALPKPSVAPVTTGADALQGAKAEGAVVDHAPGATSADQATDDLADGDDATSVPAPSITVPSVTPSTTTGRVPSRARAALPTPAHARPTAPTRAEPPAATNPSHL